MKLGLGEILKKVSEANTHSERVKMLQQYDCIELRQIIMIAYHPDVVWGLPKGWAPKYVSCEYHDQEAMFYKLLKREIGIFFIPGTHPDISDEKRKKLFVQVLESLTPEDAKLLCALKEKKMPYNGIYRKVVRDAFPDIVPPGVDKRKLGEERRKAADAEMETEE